MSIIYEALKKVEEGALQASSQEKESGTNKSKPDRHVNSKTRVLFVFASIILLGYFIANLVFINIGKSLKPTKLKIDNITGHHVANNADVLLPQGSINVPKKIGDPGEKNKPVNTAILEQTQKEEQPLIPPENIHPFSPSISPTEETFVLNGLFSSDNEGYALINNQIVKTGEKVSGATVRKITQDEVELETANGILRLSTRRH